MSGRLPISGAVLGIDVGFSPVRRSSAVCRLHWTEDRIGWEIERFRAVEPERGETIMVVAGSGRLLAAAFDGPLRRRLDVIGRYRCAERMLTRRLRPLIGKPGQSSAPVGKALNAGANACAGAVLNRCDLALSQHGVAIHEMAIVEAFPSSFLGVMIEDPAVLNARRGDRSDIFYGHLAASGGLERLMLHCLPERRLRQEVAAVTNHDDRAALVCAITALCIATDDYTAVGDEDGWIILPPAGLIQPWGFEALRANAAKISGTPLFISAAAEVSR